MGKGVSIPASLFIESDKLAISQTDESIAIDFPGGTASGTDTYTVSITGIEAYVTDLIIGVKFTNANTGSSTINVNSLGSKTLKKSVSTNLAASDIAAGQSFLLYYDGINFQVIGLGGGGGGTPGGSNTQVQFNDSSAFGGDAGLVYNKTTDVLTVGGGVIVTAETASRIASFDGSKQIKSLDTSTYPSLTELSYLKGNVVDMNDFIELSYIRSLTQMVW